MTLFLLAIAFLYVCTLGLLRLNDVLVTANPSAYRHAMHRADPHRRTVPPDWTPLAPHVRAHLAPTVHNRLAIGATPCPAV